MIIWCKELEVKTIKTGKNAGNPYDLAHCKDENGNDCNFTLFDPELKKLFANAKENSQAIDLVTETKGNFTNAVSGKLLEVGGEHPPVGGIQEHSDAVNDARAIEESAGKANPPQPLPAPQAVGMWWKVVADLIIAGKLSEVLGKENAISALEEFRGTMLSTLRIPFKGSDFPKYE